MGGWTTLIGDLHGRTPKIRPDSRMLLLAGDVCPDGGPSAQFAYLDGPFRHWIWTMGIPVVMVAGNHDYIFERPEQLPKDLPVIVLKDELVKIDGLTIWGMPWCLKDSMAFGVDTEEEIEVALSGMPSNIDILLTHNPPLGIGDKPSSIHLGSLALRHAAWKKTPRLHVFGHVHGGRGAWREGSTYYVNATLGSGCDNTWIPLPAPHDPWGLADCSWRR